MYNNFKERKQFNKFKRLEENKLREEGVSEDIINELYQFDKRQFNQNRKFMEHEIPLSKVFDYSKNSISYKSTYTIDELLDEIEYETLFLLLKRTDKIALRILLLRVDGYTNRKIASILNISESTIRQRISRLRKKLKNNL